MKIGTRVLVTNISFLLIVGLMGALAIYESMALQTVVNDGKRITSALRHQMEGDMMHDGLRADVLYALKVAGDGNLTEKEAAIESTLEHIENFNSNIAEVEKLNISKNVNKVIAELKDPLDRYTKSADQLTQLSFKNIVAAKAGYTDFEKNFEYLEGAMGEFGDVIQAEFENVQLNAEKKETQINYFIGLGISLSLVFALFNWFKTKTDIVNPIISMCTIMGELAKENFDVIIPGADRKDEIGQMASSVEVFKKNGLEAKRLRDEQVINEKRATEEKKRAVREMADNFEAKVGGTIQNLSVASLQLQDAALKMEQTANETTQASTSVAGASEETSTNVGTVASATEEMAASAQEISVQVASVAKRSNEAALSASNTSQKVNQLNILVGNIGEVVNAIKDIAEQTNLLALNATIEAARAGEAGKGFAVVADEVKKLAVETSKKTEEIESRITLIQAATQDSVTSMQEIIKGISDIDGMSASAAGAVEEQNSVLSEITRNISEVSQAAQEVAGSIAQVRAAANETGQMSLTLKNSADEISRFSVTLSSAVKNFLREVRS